MNQEKAGAIAAGIFKSYPTSDELFVTTDGQVFFSDNDATNHGRSLKGENADKVFPVKREDKKDDKSVDKAKALVEKYTAEVEAANTAVTEAGEDEKKKGIAQKKLDKAKQSLEDVQKALVELEGK